MRHLVERQLIVERQRVRRGLLERLDPEPAFYKSGVLTVATDNPVYDPWFTSNTPSNGKGYESAVAYAIATQLGFGKSKLVWVSEPFDSSYAPGPKKFDFDINEVSYTAARAQAVTFSDSYYPVQQAIVAMKGTPIVTKHSPAELKTYLYGDQIGTTGLTFITTNPADQQPKVFNTLADAVAALQAHRIDALITDTPTAQYMASPADQERQCWSRSSRPSGSTTAWSSPRATRWSPASTRRSPP